MPRRVLGRHTRPAGSLRRRTQVGVAIAVVLAAIGGFVVRGAFNALADLQTAGVDNYRTGWDHNEPNLAPSTVSGSNFGQLFATKVDGQVYAQPLVIGSTVVVATENDMVYGIDAVSGTVKWSDNFGPTWPAATIGCADLTPNLGSTSTGVYDPSSNTVYLTTKVNNGVDALHPNWYLHAVDAGTGAERSGWPVKILGTPANDPNHPFSPYDVNQRPGLLLMDGVVYMAFGSQCDYGTYVGWVAGVNLSTHAINMWSDEVGVSSHMAGIWQGGGGLVSDGSGRIFVSTGNGVTAPNAAGTTPPQQLSQSVVRLGVAADGVISAKDFFSPANAATLDQNDQDLGSGGPIALPSPYFGTSAVPNLMVEVGKEGRLFLLNRDNLGGKAQGTGGTDSVVQSLGPYKGLWGHPAAYGGEGGYVYYTQNASSLLAFKYGTDGTGKPALSLAGNSAETYGYTSGSPLVTSDGTTAGSGVVWVVGVDGPTGANGRLCAYNAVPANNRMNLLRCFPIGTGVKFATPAASAGRVYVGTRDGYLYGFGQPVTAALNLPQTSFGNVLVSQTGQATVTATATRTVTVTAVTTTAPFAVATQPALPVTLNAGQTLSVPVSFAPTAPGSTTGTLSFAATDGSSTITLGGALQGVGVRPGFTGSPAQLDFGDIAVGATETLSVGFTNTGTADETITSVTSPAAPFTASGMPATSTVVAPGQSVNVAITFTPTATGSVSSSVSVGGPDGTGTVVLKGNGVTGHAQLSVSPAALSFGSIPVGLTATQTLTVSNTGNLNVTVTKAAPPALPFVVNTPLPEGQVLTPGDSLQVLVTFAPTATGAVTGHYTISSNDGQGSHDVAISGTGVDPAGGKPLPALGAGGWVFNGSAAMSGTDLVLTTATSNQDGSAVFSSPVASSGLKASFTASIGGGNGADGLTFAMLDAASATPTSLGAGGGGLGVLGLHGVAVTLDTFKGGNDPSSNFVGLSAGTANGALSYVATATNVPNLRTGTHTVGVAVSGTTVSVTLDGTSIISAAVAGLPASVLPAFTGSTGGSNDRHAVSNVAVSAGGTALPPPGSGWRFNGGASMAGSSAILTQALPNTAGSAFYSDPVATDNLVASFSLSINGGSGADGTTFALLDPAQNSATSVGGVGSRLGFAGLAGVAVAFVTYPQSGVNSNNFVALLTSTPGATAPTVVASSTNVPPLRGSTRNAVVRVVGTTLAVMVDGVQVLSASVPSLPTRAIVGYTASTGGSTDVHAVTNAQVLTGGAALGTSAIPAPPAAGWTDNGSATTSGTGTVQLTPAAAQKAGTAFWHSAVPTARLDAKFTLQMNGGTGADGAAFVLADPAKSSATSVGAAGGGLGYLGLTGVAVCFVTYQHTGYPSSNFVGISTGGSNGALTFVATSTSVPALRTGTHAVEVSAGGVGDLVVKVDGKLVLDTKVAVPANALVGFSAGTGSITDVHAVSGVTVTY